MKKTPIKKYEDLSFEEKEEIKVLLYNWLNPYTDEVIKKVLQKTNDILNNDVAMYLLRELTYREQKEKEDMLISIEMLIIHYDRYAKFDTHNNALLHSKSYRDVLYDMFILD